MKALLDLNVLLDVIQNRQPHYADSAGVLPEDGGQMAEGGSGERGAEMGKLKLDDRRRTTEVSPVQ
jgi:hypothetical protein